MEFLDCKILNLLFYNLVAFRWGRGAFGERFIWCYCPNGPDYGCFISSALISAINGKTGSRRGVVKSTTNNPVLNCQYQIGGKRAYKTCTRVGGLRWIYMRRIFLQLQEDRCQKFPHLLQLSSTAAARLAAEIPNGQNVSGHISFEFSDVQNTSSPPSKMMKMHKEWEYIQCDMCPWFINDIVFWRLWFSYLN